LEFRLSRSKSAIAARLAHVYTPTAKKTVCDCNDRQQSG
jgi:hypothetical protein